MVTLRYEFHDPGIGLVKSVARENGAVQTNEGCIEDCHRLQHGLVPQRRTALPRLAEKIGAVAGD